MKKQLSFSIIISLLLFTFDRLTKYWALIALQEPKIIIPDFVNLELMFNRGISWSLFTFDSDLYFWILTFFVFSITALIGWYAFSGVFNNLTTLGMLFICVGSFSNILDRLLYKGVIDFININIGSLIWPSFNIADCVIVVGTIIMLWGQYKND